MHMRLSAIALALIGGTASLAMPATSHAGNVGFYKAEGACPGFIGDASAAITVAGHTPVTVTTLDAASLAPLDGLVIAYICTTFASNQAVADAVANGMALYIDGTIINVAALPGSPAVTFTTDCNFNVPANLVPGTPIITGPGGTLTEASLDGVQYCSGYSYVQSPLPPGLMPLLTTDQPDRISSFSYTYGSGRVVVSSSQRPISLPGGLDSSHFPGTETLYSNVLAWIVPDGPTTTCASEGYTGTKLTWCKNICESDLPQATLDIWIHRWINRYRDLPYCAREKEEGPPQEQPPA